MRKSQYSAVAVCALAFAGERARAGRRRSSQTGQVVGDKAATVKLRVKVKSGTAVKVAGFKAKNVFTRCDGRPSRGSQYTALTRSGQLDNKFEIELDGGERSHEVQGKVKDNGNATNGQPEDQPVHRIQRRTCKTPKQRFKTFR